MAPSVWKLFRRDSKISIRRARTEPSRSGTVYTTLPDSTKYIRLCRVIRTGDVNTGGEKIEVIFEIVPLVDSKGTYRALSYVWGDPNDCIDITVNGQRFPVTRNLEYWLRRIQALGYGDRIWIDQLSINQHDNSEKDQQVLLMGPVYQGANEVLIGVCDQLDPNDHTSVRDWLEGMLIDLHLKDLDCFSVPSPPPSLSPTPDAMSKNPFLALLRSLWFTRTWTVQEFCLAQHSKLICPWGDVSWAVFVKAFMNWNKHRRECCEDVVDAHPGLMEECHRSLEHTRKYWKGQHILQTMQLFMHLNVTNPRDKVYGLRALHQGSEDLPAPNYEQPVPGVFIDFTLWAFRDVQSLFPLAYELHQECSNTPSWAMNLSVPPDIDRNYWRRRLSGVGLHKASNGIPFMAELASPGCLRVQGIQVGHIEAVTDQLFSLPKYNFDLTNVLRSWYDFANDRRVDSLVLGRVDSLTMDVIHFDDWFCSTMLGNQVEDRMAQESDLAKWRVAMSGLIKDPFAFVDFSAIVESHMTAVLGRRMFRTDTGYVGVSPASTKVGDTLWVLGGGNVRSMSNLRPR
ncbi:hypothetical protein LTR56_023215 [Elasticomyces elasticus]|nr:hypothetical protein LTR56_023215 [Elasticomyces elasticus]KAK3626337.1 hypothetical protein LTR22_023204 [Elasticomyces elasticus]KAK4915962.1 hypothetical protein LTR49_015997 [Elasticomyces elasticus]KAK5754013.1 hypothetical protein LTS12_015867 [Elasticomyces elasticus]